MSSPPFLASDDDDGLDSCCETRATSPASSEEASLVKQVRFFIVDDADDDDAQGRFFTTQDHAPEMNKLRSGSLWTAMHLEWLGVEYDPETVYLIDFSATDVSPALAERIELIRKGIEALDMDAVKARRVNFEALGWPAYYFDAAYKALVRVIQRPLELHPPAQPYNTPPRQTTVPANPNLSKESDMSTGSSASCESKPEPFTERFMDEFVTGVLASIQNQLAMPIPWLNKDDGFYLSMERNQSMSSKLGYEVPEMVNDGGISLCATYKNNLPPVFSMEAKRKKHKSLALENVHLRHAAQIYAEMLGQVCHKRFFENPYTKYQEAFVLHARHATFYLFYAKFPNSYLYDIAQHGAQYHSKCPDTQPIRLQQSRPYRMRFASEQAEFFTLLATLFNYMVSGNSHIGFLSNNPGKSYLERKKEEEERVEVDGVVVRMGWKKYLEDNSEGELDGEEDISDAEFEDLDEEDGRTLEMGMGMDID